jgi:hypothetical protein
MGNQVNKPMDLRGAQGEFSATLVDCGIKKNSRYALSIMPMPPIFRDEYGHVIDSIFNEPLRYEDHMSLHPDHLNLLERYQPDLEHFHGQHLLLSHRLS